VGQVGEVLLQSPALMMGYYHDPERTAEAMRGGWFHTGDDARQDEDGFFFFVDRKKDIIRRRGENIASVGDRTGAQRASRRGRKRCHSGASRARRR